MYISELFTLCIDMLIYRVRLAETTEEYWDCHNHFMLYYGRDIQPMKDLEKKKKKDKVCLGA